MTGEFSSDPSVVAWAKHVIEEMAPKMRGSAMVAQIVPSDGRGDVKFWVELGASIMMDKPIIAIVFGDQEIPGKLALIADEIVRLPDGVTPQGSREVAEAMLRLQERLG